MVYKYCQIEEGEKKIIRGDGFSMTYMFSYLLWVNLLIIFFNLPFNPVPI